MPVAERGNDNADELVEDASERGIPPGGVNGVEGIGEFPFPRVIAAGVISLSIVQGVKLIDAVLGGVGPECHGCRGPACGDAHPKSGGIFRDCNVLIAHPRHPVVGIAKRLAQFRHLVVEVVENLLRLIEVIVGVEHQFCRLDVDLVPCLSRVRARRIECCQQGVELCVRGGQGIDVDGERPRKRSRGGRWTVWHVDRRTFGLGIDRTYFNEVLIRGHDDLSRERIDMLLLHTILPYGKLSNVPSGCGLPARKLRAGAFRCAGRIPGLEHERGWEPSRIPTPGAQACAARQLEFFMKFHAMTRTAPTGLLDVATSRSSLCDRSAPYSMKPPNPRTA